MATHPNFMKLLADIEIYVDGIAAMQIQNLNAWADVARAEIMEDLKEAHKGDSASAPENSAAEELKWDMVDVANFKRSRAEKLIMLFCKQTKLKYSCLTEEEKQRLTRIAQKSELARSPVNQRGKKR